MHATTSAMQETCRRDPARALARAPREVGRAELAVGRAENVQHVLGGRGRRRRGRLVAEQHVARAPAEAARRALAR